MRVNFARVCWVSLGVLMMVVLAEGSLYAGAVPAPAAPEIDGSSILTGLGVLGAGVLMLRARRSK